MFTQRKSECQFRVRLRIRKYGVAATGDAGEKTLLARSIRFDIHMYHFTVDSHDFETIRPLDGFVWKVENVSHPAKLAGATTRHRPIRGSRLRNGWTPGTRGWCRVW